MKKTITAEEFDEKFDNGEDISEYIDWSSARRIDATQGARSVPVGRVRESVTGIDSNDKETKRVNVDFPPWMIEAMDKEADRIGITRQAFIKVVLAERLDALARS